VVRTPNTDGRGPRKQRGRASPRLKERRTEAGAMSANDPKRTLLKHRVHRSRSATQIRSGLIAARVSATLKGGGDPVGRQQGNLGLDADYRVGVEGEAIPLPNGGENDRCFHQGKAAPHT
jgi:hypothetical protein